MRGTRRWTTLAILAVLASVASTTTVVPFRALPAEAQVSDADAPSTPAGARWSDTTTGVVTVSVAAEDGRARAAWRASTDALSGVASYLLQVDTHPDFAQPVLERSVAAASRSLVLGPADGLRYGSAYYFRVAAVDGAGNISTWSASSGRLLVTDQTAGPAIVHAPVATAYVGQDIPISLTATCEGEERTCAARLFWRSTPLTGVDAALDGVFDEGWQVLEMARGASTVIDANRDAFEWSATIPGAAVSTTGVDYYLETEDTGALATFPGAVFVGSRYATGIQPAAHVFHHVGVVSPPVIAHVAPLYARDGEAVPIDLQATCSTGSCSATLFYRSTEGGVLDEDLLAAPSWPRVAMSRLGDPLSLGDAGELVSFTAQIPGDVVDSRGVDYFVHVSDEATQAWWPGTTYQGYYAPTDGMRTAWHHLHTLESPHAAHQPTAASPYRQPIAVEAQASCTSGTCTGRLYYRTTTSDVLNAESFDSSEMAVASLGTVAGVEAISLSGTVPATYADTRGVDYFFSVTDGATTTWWPGTSHVDGYVPIEGVRAAYHHIRIIDPPHFAHVPATVAPALQGLTIETELTCVVADCAVELSYTATPTKLAPAFVSVPMERITEPRSTPTGLVARWRGLVPAADVTTTGIGYFLRASDGHVSGYQPGTSYSGAYVPIDGVRTGVHVVRVLEPPHLLHAPVATAYYEQPIAVEARSNCATGACAATLHWRTSGQAWRQAPMALANGGPTTPAGETVAMTGTIPAPDVTTAGVDYWIEITDGYAIDRTVTNHTTVLAPTAILHAPVLTALPNVPITVDAAVPCSTPTCAVELFWRAPGERLLAEPAWKRTSMPPSGAATSLAGATVVTTHRASIPAGDVTTRGVEYFIRAFDGHTTAHSPGTAYSATPFTRLEGTRVHYFSVHVVEPVRIAHVPVVTASDGDPIDILATANCAATCHATLGWRATPPLTTTGQVLTYALGGPPFSSTTMDQRVVADLDGGGKALELRARIPAAAVTTAGVDYWFSITDGGTTAYFPGTSYLSPAGSADGTRAAWQHVTVGGARTTATIGDLVWIDQDADGAQDIGEPPLAGVMVRLEGAGLDGLFSTLDDLPTAELRTDRDGVYNFTNLLPGRYRVAVDAATLPAGVVRVSGASPRTLDVSLGQDVNDADVGYRHSGRVGGVLFADEDDDASFSAADSALAGVDLDVQEGGLDGQLGTSDDRTFRLTTDAGGRWEADGIASGPVTLVVVGGTLPAGLAPASDPPQATLSPGQQLAGLDYAFRYTGALSGTAYVDEDDNRSPTDPDSRLAGLRMEVREAGPDGAQGTPDDRSFETTTGPDGGWRVEGLAGRPLVVRLLDVPGPELAPYTSLEVAMALDAGEDRRGIDFAFNHTASASGSLYHDLDGDRTRGAEEPGVADVGVELVEAGPDGILGTADDRTRNTATDANGGWRIERLGPRSVVPSFELSDLPPGLRLVATPDEVVLTAAADTPGLDFAFVEVVVDPDGPSHHTIAPADLPPGPNPVVLDGIVDGLRIEIASPTGQLYPSDVFIRPADELMAGAGSLMAGPAFDITLPPVPIEGAQLTLPYDEANLAGFAEADLAIWTFDEGRQLWMPVPGPVVDAENNTVTAHVEHFSAYAVLKVRSADDWQSFFGDTPVLCAAPGSTTVAGFDVAFLTDTSGSMGSNDPNRLRVDGAKQFTDAMSDLDRAAVVGFTTSATTYIGLTPLDTAEGRSAVAGAIDQTGRASGGTSISAAVQRGIDILGPAGGADRARAAILLTDGQSGYNHALTTQAAEAGVVIHTVGLGSGANQELLRSIAEGTGGTYRFLASAAGLPELYQELVGDLIDTGRDTDGDDLTDCEERHGMFTPVKLLMPEPFGGASGRFVTSDWRLPDTDGDGRSDGEELQRRRFADDAEASAAYPFFAAAGVEHYYLLDSDPNLPDTDGDGLKDDREVTECEPPLESGVDCDGWPFLAGTSDPLLEDSDGDGADDLAEYLSGGSPTVPDRWWYAASGLDIPAFTLIQPHRYGTAPTPPGAWVRLDSDGDAQREPIRYVRFNRATITYDDEERCVANCTAVDNAVVARGGSDNGSGICIVGWFGTCLSEDDQERRVIREARLWLGVFDDEGYLTPSFQADQVVAACGAFHNPGGECSYAQIQAAVDDINADIDVTPALVGRVATDALRRSLPDGRLRPGPEVVTGIAALLASRIVGPSTVAVSDADIETMTRNCVSGPAWEKVGFAGDELVHPCEVLPIFSPGGGDALEAAQHKARALLDHPEWVRLVYQSDAEVLNQRGVGRRWYNATPVCNEAARAEARARRPDVPLACDEFPYYSTTSSGPGASLELLSFAHNKREGDVLSAFVRTSACAARIQDNQTPYLVVPVPVDPGPPTFFVC